MSRDFWWGELPNGKSTEDQDEYVSAWRSLAQGVLTLMPTYQTHSFDPVLGFTVGRYGYVDVPVDLAMAIRDMLERNTNLTKALADLLEHYTQYVDSVDQGHWDPETRDVVLRDPETEEVVIQAHAAIAKEQEVKDARVKTG